jgi:hypothetical protein
VASDAVSFTAVYWHRTGSMLSSGMWRRVMSKRRAQRHK